jgi:hypothetical protein
MPLLNPNQLSKLFDGIILLVSLANKSNWRHIFVRNGAMVACLLMMGRSLGGTLCPHLFIFHMFLLKLDFDLFFSLEHV